MKKRPEGSAGMDLYTLIGVLGASGMHCIVVLVSVAPTPDTAPQRPQLTPTLGPFLF